MFRIWLHNGKPAKTAIKIEPKAKEALQFPSNSTKRDVSKFNSIIFLNATKMSTISPKCHGYIKDLAIKVVRPMSHVNQQI